MFGLSTDRIWVKYRNVFESSTELHLEQVQELFGSIV